MCAINPAHKKRLILDVYTSDTGMSSEEFQNKVIYNALQTEIILNEKSGLRWHVKEDHTQEAVQWLLDKKDYSEQNDRAVCGEYTYGDLRKVHQAFKS